MNGNILIVGPSWVGDMVMAQALVQLLEIRHTGVRVDILAPAWALPLVNRMPGVSDAIASPFRHGELAWARRRTVAKSLASRHYDQAIVLPNSAKSALVPFLARIPRRTGFRGEFRFGLLNDVRRLDPEWVPRLVDRFAMLAFDRGAPVPTAPEPRLVSSTTRSKAVMSRLGLPGSPAPVCLCPGAEYGPAKRWPARHYARLAAALREAGRPVWLLGSGKDRPVTDEICELAGPGIENLAGRTSLEDAVDLLAVAGAVVTNDSGLMHVAAALERPVIALYGSSSPEYTPPLSRRAKVLRNPVPCSPCFARECPLDHFRCLTDLAPDTVLETLQTMLDDDR
ncbi:MAG: lipopolysaccharide heptosyltransferase II [Betaproteobacteria bacterium]|nr:lipopolysaccharide heptosyltransferase II [Betaproteobacteria bacterium]